MADQGIFGFVPRPSKNLRACREEANANRARCTSEWQHGNQRSSASVRWRTCSEARLRMSASDGVPSLFVI